MSTIPASIQCPWRRKKRRGKRLSKIDKKGSMEWLILLITYICFRWVTSKICTKHYLPNSKISFFVSTSLTDLSLYIRRPIAFSFSFIVAEAKLRMSSSEIFSSFNVAHSQCITHAHCRLKNKKSTIWCVMHVSYSSLQSSFHFPHGKQNCCREIDSFWQYI